MNSQQVTHVFVSAFIDELVRSGVRHVCICPGSRSTPIAMVCADHPGLRVWMHVDERSAAFFALGMARVLEEPVALVCTSGTAAANFLPAVVEAYYSRVPLVVLTADRPHEMRDVGANQTIDQVRLFGSHVKWFVDMPLPEATTSMLRYARTCASRAAALARAVPAGPVHLNFPLREPLVPLPGPMPDAAQTAPAAWVGRAAGEPYTAVAAGKPTLPAAAVQELAQELREARRGVIVCGPDTPQDAAGPILSLAAQLGWPVLADPLSGLRALPADWPTLPEDRPALPEIRPAPPEARPAPSAPEASRKPDGQPALSEHPVIDAYDVFLRDRRAAEGLEPDLILRFGALPVSKPLLLYLERWAEKPQLVVDPGAQWRDPVLAARRMIYADPAGLCRALVAALQASAAPDTAGWLDLWQALNRATRERIAEQVEGLAEPFEGRVFHELATLLPGGTVLYVGNSMPIRDMDAFFPCVPRAVRVLGNRGASGIDGVVSSALGAAAAAGVPVVLVLGDLSFYHDLNGLLAAKLHRLNATIIVINNDGGGIFSFLPQAAHPAHFETLFGTPLGLDFRPAVEMYGGRFVRASGWDGFRAAVTQALKAPGLDVIEVTTERARNYALHRQVYDAVLKDLGPVLDDIRERSGVAGG